MTAFSHRARWVKFIELPMTALSSGSPRQKCLDRLTRVEQNGASPRTLVTLGSHTFLNWRWRSVGQNLQTVTRSSNRTDIWDGLQRGRVPSVDGSTSE